MKRFSGSEGEGNIEESKVVVTVEILELKTSKVTYSLLSTGEFKAHPSKCVAEEEWKG